MRKLFQDRPADEIANRLDFENLLEGVKTIYVYPHHEIKLSDEGEFQQTRSGPNWEGGKVTMTTCKHLLRTYKSIQGGGNVAICGVTNKLNGENFIMYVGVVSDTFDSNYELSRYLEHHYPEVFRIKSVKYNRLGDIFAPMYGLDGNDRYDSLNFEEPCYDHCRKEENDSKGDPKWLKDIEYSARQSVRPKCLIVDPVTVHTTPNFIWTGKLGRSGVVFKGDDAVSDFLFNMEETL